MEGLDEDKIILITYRLPENSKFRPAEEVFMRVMLNKLKLDFEKIDYLGTNMTHFFGRLPVLYFNGKFISNRNIVLFMKELVIQQNQEGENFRIFLEDLLSILRDELRNSNEFYYFLKSVEKIENPKSFFSLIKGKFISYFSDLPPFHKMMKNSLIHSQYIHNNSFQFMTDESKVCEIIKNSFQKIFKMKNKSFLDKEENWFIHILIYSYLQEDKSMFSNIIRPGVDNLSQELSEVYSNIGNFYYEVDALLYDKEVQFTLPLDYKKIILKWCVILNPKKKKKEIQEVQARNNFYHNLFAIGTFVGVGMLIYYLTNRKKNN
jgi:hypothetical protein